MTSPRGKQRASGHTQAEEVTRAVSDEAEEVAEPTLPEDRSRRFRSTNFSRMRIDWHTEDYTVLARAKGAVEGMVRRNFGDVFQIMYELYDVVRTPVVDADGVVQTDEWGMKVWRRTSSGAYEEDWTRLTSQEKENFLFAITTRLFDWEQRAAEVWGEAMFAKALWEESFSKGYDAAEIGTIDDRTAKGRIASMEERYFAILWSMYSRKAEALVRTMTLLGQRLRDSIR